MPPWIWPFDQRRVDGAADVVRGDDVEHLDGAERRVDLHLGHLRGEAVGGVRACPGRSRRGRWLAGPRCRGLRGRSAVPDHFAGAKFRDDSHRQIDCARGLAVGDGELRAVEAQLGIRAGVGERQDLAAQVLAGESRGVAGYERLPRGRGLAGIRRQIGIADHHEEGAMAAGPARRRRSGQHGRGALADVDGAVEERQRAVARQGDAHARRVGQRGVAAAVPHAGDADAAPAPRRIGVVAGDTRKSRLPIRLQRVEALRQPGGMRQHLPRVGRIAVVERVDAPDRPAVEAEPLGQIVHQRLVGDAPPAGCRSRGRRRPACRWCRRRACGSRRWAPCRARRRAPARGWRPSVPTRHRRRC